jgi:hypothetical protein
MLRRESMHNYMLRAYPCISTEFESIDPAMVINAFDWLGPIPHIYVNFMCIEEELSKYEDKPNMAILDVTAGKIETLILASKELYIDRFLHKLCLISHKNCDDVHSRVVLPQLGSKSTLEPKSSRVAPSQVMAWNKKESHWTIHNIYHIFCTPKLT